MFVEELKNREEKGGLYFENENIFLEKEKEETIWKRKIFFAQEKKNRPKMPVLSQIWPFLGPKSLFWGAGSKNFGTLISGFQ